ncbi:unnamed protein product [Spirodela intermedia]|uniref:Uncharacterized protein n=1 Tax=Spirodela intermedia TaxID=51605 RepID=A0A7I8INK1_SPIIN|nr:unnamed protein product [Spirodela intermedia]CAA6659545.1 unnamed protein product [Spirodela intermedia]
MGDELSSTVGPRKLKFAPKIPARKPSKPAPVVKREEPEETSSLVLDHELLRRVKVRLTFSHASTARQNHDDDELTSTLSSPGRAFKDEKKGVPIQVAFGHQSAGTYARPFGVPKPLQKHEDGADGPGQTIEKEYVEPWDYYSYYPVTLPLRRPYSGNPETLDDDEFGEASGDFQLDEVRTNPAVELGLMNALLPITCISSIIGDFRAAAADSERGKGVGSSEGVVAEKRCSLEDLPAGLMGKMLVYRSGVVKMKLGDALFDVNPGSKCVFAQDVMGVNAQEKHCSLLGSSTAAPL